MVLIEKGKLSTWPASRSKLAFPSPDRTLCTTRLTIVALASHLTDSWTTDRSIAPHDERDATSLLSILILARGRGGLEMGESGVRTCMMSERENVNGNSSGFGKHSGKYGIHRAASVPYLL